MSFRIFWPKSWNRPRRDTESGRLKFIDSMPNGRINTKGRLERGKPKTNRSLLYYNETLAILNAAVYAQQPKISKERKPKVLKAKKKPVKSIIKAVQINPENIVRSVHDPLPLSKFAGSSLALFKGKSFLYMAERYPKIMIKFLEDRKELVFEKDVLDELVQTARGVWVE